MRAERSLVGAVLAMVLATRAPVELAGEWRWWSATAPNADMGRLPTLATDISAALECLDFDVTMTVGPSCVHAVELRGRPWRSCSTRGTRGTASRWTAWNLRGFGGRAARARQSTCATTAGASLRLVVLDACRNNPLGPVDPAHGSDAHGDRRQLRGLERRPVGRNSPYASVLLAHLADSEAERHSAG